MEDEKKQDEQQEKTPAELMREMQEAHNKAIEDLRKELAAEKAAHAKDVKELLLNGKTNGSATTTAEEIAAKMRKKYYK